MAGSYAQPIIVKKKKKSEHAHHGGAWKIAYADFVTAMMAFFLLLWLISMTTEEQKKGLADYFSPASISETTSGSGGVLAGTAFDTAGARTSPATKQDIHGVDSNTDSTVLNSLASSSGGQGVNTLTAKASDESSQVDVRSHFDQAFHSAAASIRQAWQALPDITKIQDNLLVQETKEGLNIQIVDQEGRPMFPEGSKYPFETTRQAIAVLGPILEHLPNQITISGHTAAGATYDNPRYGAWDLTTDRANVVRSILGEFGLSDDHVSSVTGRATADPFFPNEPYLPSNERVEITVLYNAPPVPPDMKP